MSEGLRQATIRLIEALKDMWEKIKKAMAELFRPLIDYSAKHDARGKYRAPKIIGIERTIAFFQRKIFRCRDSC